ncbi:N-acetyltransferase [Enterococcus sp. BWB1-3]|uniref:GNAT family N-acetyltransferase n=1 Tax=unclassified Enterococcus TaxID=2608891 RepID=UPI001922D262|nr:MULTISPECIES: GNAT family N-acetyltransferase [unclassified Enterococcus]MBL1230600.1 N-acetyltransferase [Enterococcus sp. BWB1-3]MCB5950905.1 N-acetyltransferase family protein [Enterococcus sp. BWT-B8]MCB5955541.1 N-acetyltransferase family protein [Enterococcus sp. CWB-B31]
MKIRLISPGDIEAVLSIYSQYIDTPITCEYALPSKNEFTQRINSFTTTYPYLVCEEEGKIIGYAYAHRHMERKAYEWNAELSIYLDKEQTAKGVGMQLYTILISILKKQGIKTVIGGVTLPNRKSQQLHEKLGFEQMGIYHNNAFKNGQWFDVAWYEKQLGPYTTPEPIIPITNLSKEEIAEIIRNSN